VGPATANLERSPNLERVRGMSSRWRDDDLRPARRAVLVRALKMTDMKTQDMKSQDMKVQDMKLAQKQLRFEAE